jgi:photosystem II stability/assembly factor-like uncharacterized protein
MPGAVYYNSATMNATVKRTLYVVVIALLTAVSGAAQWQMQESKSTASLRGIHAVSERVAWASGSQGTVLRTTDGGAHWQPCAVPPEAAELDFRAIWAWDEKNAEIMSAGPGELSRRYKTTDGCASWQETGRNEDKEGFWDAMVYQSGDYGYFAVGDSHTAVMIGDPVGGRFETHVMLLGRGWFIDGKACAALPGESAFAASNSSVFLFGSRRFVMVTGGKSGARAMLSPLLWAQGSDKECLAVPLPMAGGKDSAGAFSVYFRDLKHGVTVGGDFQHPEERQGTAAYTADGGRHWTASTVPPNGYRSGVTYDVAAKRWIAVGTNGSDVSSDDGRTWHRVDNGNWNAVSLPFAVGPKGRIGRMSPGTAANITNAKQ